MKGARWNSTGVEVIYTAQNRSLAMAEVAVHLTLSTLPEDYVMVTIEIPDSIKIKTISIHDLPNEWNNFPYSLVTQKIGDAFILENKFCVLKIPSAVTQGDYNFILNPNHKDFRKIKIKEIVKFPFNKRIFK